jgi:hypothetical protein
MENKDAQFIRKMISLVESTNEKIVNHEEDLKEVGGETIKAGLETLGDVLKSETHLFSTLKNEIPSLSKFKTAEEMMTAFKGGEIALVDANKIMKEAMKIPEVAIQVKTILGKSPKFAEVINKVYPKGSLMPPDPKKFKLASKALQDTYGLTAVEADAFLKKSASEIKSTGGVTTKSVDTALKNAGDLKSLNGSSKEVQTIMKTEAETASAQVAANGLKEDAKIIEDAATKSRVEEAGRKIGRYSAEKWSKLKALAKKMNLKSLLIYGFVGWGAWKILSSLFSDDKKTSVIGDCAMNLPDSEIGLMTDGSPYVFYKGDIDEKSKGHGGVRFYGNGRAVTTDNQMRGYYFCKGGKLQVSETDLPKGDGSTSPSDITIQWDGVASSDGGGGNSGGGNSGGGGKSKYHACTDFPFEFGCKNDKIKEVQKCLGMEPKYQTGNFGPKTLNALNNFTGIKLSDNKITQEIYDFILKNCKNAPTPQPTTTGSTSGTTVTPTAAPTAAPTATPAPTLAPPPPVPTEPVYDQNRLQELLTSDNVVRKQNGHIFKWVGKTLSGNDFYILNKYLTDQGYHIKKQREQGDEDTKYKWSNR